MTDLIDPSNPYDPTNEIPGSFWDLIEAAKHDEERLFELLEPMDKEALYAFYKTYYDAGLEISDHLAVHGVTGDASEDTLDDLGNSLVALGREVYLNVWRTGQLPARVTWEDLPMLRHVAPDLYETKFDEDAYDRLCNDQT